MKVYNTSTSIGIQYFNKEVRVYRNLTRKCYSIQHKTDKGWRVLDHCIGITLADATFVVSTAGRDRVRREGKKYVHAYVYGRIVEPSGIFFNEFNDPERKISKVFYNPYVEDSFVYEDGSPTFGLHLAIIDPYGVRVSK